MLSNWRNRPRPTGKPGEQGTSYNRESGKAGEDETVAAGPVVAAKRGNVRIPMKWGTDSGGSGAASEQAALVTVMISEAPHFRQEFYE